VCCLSKGTAACPGSKVEPIAAIRRDSVAVRLIRGQVRALLHANDLVIFDGHQQVARHDRLTGRLEAHLELHHYLEALIRKRARCQAPQHSNKPAPRRELVSTTSGENTPRLLGSVATEQQDKDYRMRRVRTASSVTDDLTAPTILQDRVFLSFVTGKGQGNLNTSGWTARTVSTSVTTRNAPRSDSPPDRRSKTRTGRSSSKPAWCQIPTFALKYDPVLKQL
jgi:hypothetical protein